MIDLTPQVDISVTKTDGVTSVAPGSPTTYTMIVSNAGPSSATGVRVTDALPVGAVSGTWTCTAGTGGTCTTPSGTFPIDTTVDFAGGTPGGQVTFSATLQTSPAAVGSLTNTVSADAPAGVTDTNSGNNQATDVDTLTPQSDVSVTKTDGLTSIAAGQSLTYTITVSSGGPSVINPVAVDDDLPAGLTATTWTCAASSGSSCAAGSGSGSIHSSVNLLVGGSATYTVTGTVLAQLPRQPLQHRDGDAPRWRDRSHTCQQHRDRRHHRGRRDRSVGDEDRWSNDRRPRDVDDLHDRRQQRRSVDGDRRSRHGHVQCSVDERDVDV